MRVVIAALLVGSTLALAPLAPAQVFNLQPAVSFSVHDEPVDGLGDSFNATPFEGLIRTQSTRQDRALQEFSLASLPPGQVISATLSGLVSVNNAFDNGVRTFDFLLFAGNGQADLSDFQAPATVVGTGSYHPPIDTSFTYSFDVTSIVANLVATGATHVALRVEGTSNPNFPNILDSGMSQLQIKIGTGAFTDLGGGSPGTNGVPSLTGQGTFQAGTNVTLTLTNALPNASASLVLSAQAVFLPISGGTLVPFPNIVIPAIPTDAQGQIVLGSLLPPGLASGIPLYFQYVVADPGGQDGIAFSSALTVTTP